MTYLKTLKIVMVWIKIKEREQSSKNVDTCSCFPNFPDEIGLKLFYIFKNARCRRGTFGEAVP